MKQRFLSLTILYNMDLWLTHHVNTTHEISVSLPFEYISDFVLQFSEKMHFIDALTNGHYHKSFLQSISIMPNWLS